MTQGQTASLADQAGIFSQYLIGQSPPPELVGRYQKFILNSKPALTPTEEKTLQFALKHPNTIAYIDAYSAIFNPTSELRRRIFIMFAILESYPKYSQLFLPEEHGAWYFFSFALTGLRASLRLIVGALLVKLFWGLQ